MQMSGNHIHENGCFGGNQSSMGVNGTNRPSQGGMLGKQPEQSALRESVSRQEPRQYDNAFASFRGAEQNQ